MMQWTLTYLSSLVTFIVIDIAWITLVARKLYELEASDVIREKPQLGAGILFYLLYAAGVAVFSIYPLTQHFNGIHATFPAYRDVGTWGAGLGLFAYATFSLTNQSIIKQWRYKLAIADMLWGAVLTAAVSLVGFAVYRALA